MIRAPYRHLLLAAALPPVALGLAGCKNNASAPTGSGAVAGPVAPPAGKTWAETVAEGADGAMILGNPAAPIKLVEYGSLSCPHCAKLSQDGYASLIKDFVSTGRVSYEFRSYAIHPQDVPLTMLARCSGKDAFFALTDQIYTNFDAMNEPLAKPDVQAKLNAVNNLPAAQRLVAISDAAGFTDFFTQRGISVDQAHACLSDMSKAQQIAGYAQKYSDAGVTQTPTVTVNGNPVEVTGWDAVATALRNAGAR